ncbi:MAG: hypothetical protein AUK34_09555 [Ignavibacteria bacterium CG2_30_36_16]|nr:MAG: hypothetical protein AUK34_09555 [Ignavibacteria bacterium CG2_30_36_16]PJB01026.1 MAG: hypothetical protein CO127_05985 [Ignavibacteria bacterium CG_4_9_14_3_um_filter_36_18]
MKLLKVVFVVLILSHSFCFSAGKNENKIITDTTRSERIISIRFGCFPYFEPAESPGLFTSVSTNGDFQNYFDFGYYLAAYAWKENSKGRNVYILGGVNYGHKFDICNRQLIVRLGLCVVFASYPAVTTVVEIDYPIILFKSSSINVSITTGGWFHMTLPFAFSVAYSF